MPKQDDRRSLFENIVRLRRVERDSPGNPEVGTVRLGLEELLGGGAVTPSFAARMLGVSHTALARWIESGDVTVVTDPDGRRSVPVSLLADLYEAIARERDLGRRHALESVVLEARARAERLPTRSLLPEGEGPSGESLVSERRSLAYHRAVARRLDRSTADMALALLRYWRERGSIEPVYAEEWEAILQGPLAGIRKALEDEGRRGQDLRQNSPFAGVLSEAERERILAEIL